MNKELFKLVDETLRFRYLRGGEQTEAVDPTTWMASPDNVLSSRVNAGESPIFFEGMGQVVQRCQGDTFFIPAGTARRSAVPHPTTNLYCWSHLQFTILHDVDLLGLLGLKPIFFPKKVSAQLAQWLGELARLDQLDPGHEALARMVAVKSLGFSILRTILEHAQTDIDITEKLVSLERFSPIFSYINEHLDEKISLSKLAEQVKLSPFHFHRQFKQAVGVSPLAYTRKKKMAKAQALLLSTGFTLSEIAAELGFADSFTFSKSFKHCTGFTPKAYRGTTWPTI